MTLLNIKDNASEKASLLHACVIYRDPIYIWIDHMDSCPDQLTATQGAYESATNSISKAR
jgi:hypothetical protein